MLANINGLFRLTRNGELKYGSNGTPILNLGIACSEKYKEKETQLFLDATVFGKPAEIINQYAGTKGTQIYLSGKLQTEQWVDNNTQQKRSKTAFIVEKFDFVSGQSNNQQQQAPQQPQYNQQVPTTYEKAPAHTDYRSPPPQRQSPPQPQGLDVDSGDIPF